MAKWTRVAAAKPIFDRFSPWVPIGAFGLGSEGRILEIFENFEIFETFEILEILEIFEMLSNAKTKKFQG